MDETVAPIEAVAPIETPVSVESIEAEVSAATPAEAMYKLLVDGVEEEVSIEELKRLASHGKGAAARMTEAQKLKADTQRLLDVLKKDPIAVRKELEKEFDEKSFLSTRLAQIMEEEMQTPEEKQAKQDALELQQFRERKKAEQEDRERKDLELTMNSEIEALDKEFAEAFEKVGLPKTNEARKRLAVMMLEAQESGKSIPTETLALQVKKEMQADIIALLKSSDDEAFEELLGSDLLTKAQKISLKKVKVPGERTVPTNRTSEKKTEEEKARPRRKDDFLAEMGIF